MNRAAIVHDEYRRCRNIPFVWGVCDCLMSLPAETAFKITGVDPIKHLRGKYKSALEAKRVMDENGWATMGDVAASIYSEIPLALVQTGDWVFVINEDGTGTIGVVIGDKAACKTKTGVGFQLVRSATRAFRVA